MHLSPGNPNRIASLIERLARLMRSSEHASGLNPAQIEALRYLAACNRFSNSPSALAEYLAVTKGSVSQTIQALERKGLVTKAARKGRGRAVAIALTEAGQAVLSRDPWHRMSDQVMALDRRDRAALGESLSAILRGLLAENGRKSFGVCRSCRYFERGGGVPGHPDRCGLLKLDLAPGDVDLICAEHRVPAAA